jgi:hypothetical protein
VGVTGDVFVNSRQGDGLHGPPLELSLAAERLGLLLSGS